MKRGLAAIVVFALMLSMFGCAYIPEQTEPASDSASDPTVQTAAQPTTEPATEPTTEPATQPTTEPTVPPTEPVAERIADGFSVRVDGEDYSYRISDDNHYTKYRVDPWETLTVASEQPFSALYIQWDETPEEFTILWEGGSMQCGQEGFLHDYIRLPEAVSAVEFRLAEGVPLTLCDIAGYTYGVAPEGVQDWREPCTEADVLVFPTHSDDDVLFFGPLLSYYAIERQLTVQTAFMVQHDSPVRAHERLNGLWAMGIRHYPILGTAPDHGSHSLDFCLRYYADSDILGWQIEQIRRFQPLVVVGHDLDGEYGNGGHKVNALYLTQAVEAAKDPLQYPQSAFAYGVWDTPKLYLHLYGENQMILEVNTPLSNDPGGRTAFEIAVDAYDNHPSQHRWFARLYQGEQPRYDCRPFGLYRSLVGFDTTADIMENIVPEQWRSEEEE